MTQHMTQGNDTSVSQTCHFLAVYVNILETVYGYSGEFQDNIISSCTFGQTESLRIEFGATIKMYF